MGRKKKDDEEPIIEMGCPEWMLTFGDCMSLLLCFFVMLIAFSEQDDAKLMTVLGSMKGAFGVIPLEHNPNMRMIRDPKEMTKLIENEDLDKEGIDRVEEMQVSPVLLNKLDLIKEFEEVQEKLTVNGFENVVSVEMLRDGLHFKLNKNEILAGPGEMTRQAQKILAPIVNMLINVDNEIRLVDYFFVGDSGGVMNGVMACKTVAEFLNRSFSLSLTRMGHSVQAGTKEQAEVFEIVLMNQAGADEVTLEDFKQKLNRGGR